MRPMDARPVPAWERAALAPLWGLVALAVALLLARDALCGGKRRRRVCRAALAGGTFWVCFAEIG